MPVPPTPVSSHAPVQLCTNWIHTHTPQHPASRPDKLELDAGDPGVHMDMHISGLPTLHLSAVPTFDGGQIFIEMQDAETGMRIGHATMDVRYHEGGYEPQTVIPGQQITMMMEFQGIDAILPAGHGLRFIFSEQGEDYLAPACGSTCTVHILPSSLRSLGPMCL